MYTILKKQKRKQWKSKGKTIVQTYEINVWGNMEILTT